MRIHLLTQWFDPEPTFKGMLFAQELRRLGHDVTVITGFPNYPGGKLYPGYRMRLWHKERLEGIDVVRVPLYPSHSKSALGRIANYISFALTSSLGALLLRRPDVVYVYHPPGTAVLAGLVSKWFKAAPFVLDIQDLWPDSLAATEMLRGTKLQAAVGWFMRAAYHHAAHIVVLSPGFAKMLNLRGVPPEKLTVIPNWTYAPGVPASDAFTVGSPDQTENLANARLKILFAGNMGVAQDLETVLEAARILLREDLDVSLNLVGDGVEASRLKTLAVGLTNVRLLPRRPPEAMASLYAAADALLVHLKDDPLFSITIPSKTQAYLQAGKPILMAVRGDAADMIARAQAGVTVEPENPAALAKAIRRLAEMNPMEREEMGRNGARYYAENLALAKGVQSFEQVFDHARFSMRRGLGLKRLGDFIVALTLLMILAVPLALLAFLVALKLGRPVLFRQERPGRYGKVFEILKFRTMTDGRDGAGNLLPDRDRLTPFGRLLRSSSLDELPALINVIRGDMSLVGPRPLLMRYTQYFTSEEKIRLVMRPGITGWAQVNGRNQTPWSERLLMDSWYVRNWSLRLDVVTLVRTALRVMQRKDVVVDAESIMQNLDDERRTGEAGQ